MQVWPIEVDLKFMEPVGRELKSVGKVNFLLCLVYCFNYLKNNPVEKNPVTYVDLVKATSFVS